MHSLFITGERGIWLLRWDLFRCQTVNIWLMTPFLFTMTYYMKMTQETTRTRESIVLELVSKNSLFSLTAQPPVTQGVTAEGRESSRQATEIFGISVIPDRTRIKQGRKWRSSWKTWANSRVTCPFLYPKQMKPVSHSFLYLVQQAGVWLFLYITSFF